MNPKLPGGRHEFESLLNCIFDEGGSDEDRMRLGALLAEHAELRTQYADWMRLHANLIWRYMPGKPLSAEELRRHALVEAAADETPPEQEVSGIPARRNVPPADGRQSVPDTDGAALSRSPVLAPFFPTRGLGRRLDFLLAFAALLLVALGIAWIANQRRGNQDVVIAPSPAASPESASPVSQRNKEGPAVARLVRTYDCAWSSPNGSIENPVDGDSLTAGQQLSLRGGLAEIVFSSGARVILQGPAQFQIESPLAALLSSGKITATVEAATAKGFTIHTPGMEAIDLGTEFGLEVSRNGLEQVHVFRGEVNVNASPAKGPAAVARRLTQNQGIEVNLNTKGVKLVANNGERFARSLDEAQKSRHVVAHWRFEDHPEGVLVPESQEGQAPVRGSLDSSLNGNDLYTWNRDTQPQFSGDVPAAVVPKTGDANLACLDNSVPPGSGVWTRDLFTMSHWSRPGGTDLQTITPACWTVEASVKPANLNNTFQTFVVRDGANACVTLPKLTPFALYITPGKHFEVRYCDVEKRAQTATAQALTVAENRWYHVAATSDGANLKLFVDSLDGKGYVMQAMTALPTTGSTALGRGEFPPSDLTARPSSLGYPYIWSVGRGYYDGRAGNWFPGWIDEVRICDVAREPSEFLFANRAGTTIAAGPARMQAAEETADER